MGDGSAESHIGLKHRCVRGQSSTLHNSRWSQGHAVRTWPRRYCQHRQVGAMYDTNTDKWEAQGPVTQAEWLEALNVMDARLEAAAEVDLKQE